MKAAIFDVDGTLTDSVHLRAKAWQVAFRHFGYSIPFHEIRSQIGKCGDQLLPVFLSKDEIESKGDDLEYYRDEVFRRDFLPKIKPFARVRELFERLLEDDWKIVLASSAKNEDLEAYKQICRIADLPEIETPSDMAEESEAPPDIFHAAMNRLGKILPEECVVVGDSPYDAAVAGKAHVRSVGFLSGGFAEEDLERAGFDTLYWGTPDLYVKYEESIFGHRAACRKGNEPF